MVVGTGTVTYKNTVEARGKSKYVEKDVDMGSSGGGEASQFSVKVVKVDGYDANKKLQEKHLSSASRSLRLTDMMLTRSFKALSSDCIHHQE